MMMTMDQEEDTIDLDEWRDLMRRNTIDWDPGWNFIQKLIPKLKNILECAEDPKEHFSSAELMIVYSTICKMCGQKPPHDYSQRLYDKYRETFEEYIPSTVLPSLREKHDEFMLRELVKRWSNHKTMVTYFSRLFCSLDQYFAPKSLPGLEEVGLTCFRDLVYQELNGTELNGKVRDAVISLIDQEREGKQIDRALLKNVLDIFVKMGSGQVDYYENDFEAAMLKDTAAYYSRKASNWILKDSCSDYRLKAEECLQREKDRVTHYLHSSSAMKLLEKVQHELLTVYVAQLLEKEYSEKVQHELLTVYVTQLLGKEHSGCHALPRDDKVEELSAMYRLFSKMPKGSEPVASVFKQAEECLKREKDRVAHYLHSSSEMKLFEKVQHEMLTVYHTQLLGKEHSGCHAVLRDDKVQDLSRMFRLFSKIPKGLEPVSNIFKQHVTAEGTALVKHAEDAVSNKKVFIKKVIELHDKYLSYVNDCFMNHSFFHKALKEAFEVFCNKVVAESSSVELLAIF